MKPSSFARPCILLFATVALASCAAAPRIVEPPCERPAPLLGQYDGRAPGYQVRLRPSDEKPSALLERHGLKARDVGDTWIALERVSPKAIARLRCEPGVESIQFDAYFHRLAL